MRYLLLFIIFAFSLSGEEKKPAKKTICLNMIVKNEAHVIKRCLDSVINMIDTWVIVDTGSTDGTQKLIQEILKQKPGKLYEKPWVNFGRNRQEALELAKGKADYILFMDADDILSFDTDFKMPELVDDFYSIKTRYSVQLEEFLMPQLVKADIPWVWQGVLHEYIIAKVETKGSTIDGVTRIYYYDGARSKDPNATWRDIALLEEGMKSEPRNGRYMFYLGHYYTLVNDLENAIRCYRKVPALDAHKMEIFWSRLRLGKLLQATNAPDKDVEEAYLTAYQFSCHSMEPLYYLANYIRSKGDFKKAYEMTRLAIHVALEEQGVAEAWVYDYGLPFEYAMNACELGRIEECLDVCNCLLTQSDLPDVWFENVSICKKKALEKMKEEISRLFE